MHVYILWKKKTRETVINIGTGKDLTIRQYADLFLKIILPKSKVGIIYDKSKPNGTPRKVMDVSLARKYGWYAKTDLKTAILKTYNNYLRENN